MDTTSNNEANVEVANINSVATDPMPQTTADSVPDTEADTTAVPLSDPTVLDHKDAVTSKATADPQPEVEPAQAQITGEELLAAQQLVARYAVQQQQQASGAEISEAASNGEDDVMEIDETPPTTPAPKSKGKGKARLQEVAVGEVAFDSPITKKEMLAFLDQHSIDAYPVKRMWIQIARKLLENQGDLPLSKAQLLVRLDKYAINATKETLEYIEVARRMVTSLKDSSAPNGKGNGGEQTPKRKREAEVTQESQAGEVKRQKPNTKESKEDSKKIEEDVKFSEKESINGGQMKDDKEAQFRRASTWSSSDGRMNMQSGFR